MEATHGRGRGFRTNGAARRPYSRNKQWVAGQDSSGHASGTERWERGGHRRARGRGRGSPHLATATPPVHDDIATGTTDDEGQGDVDSVDGEDFEIEDKDPDTPEEREKFYQELVKAREIERKKAIAEGKMDDPLVPKRLEDAITMVGTCMEMCPRFERYRRERENNLDRWEVIPGTKRVDHKRAVKIYERAAGDKTLPSDLRPPEVLKKTLDYLFHDLIQNGFSETYNFIRDRSRAVRSDFTLQHETGPMAIECHDRCARYHVLALHFERDNPGFSITLEEQQLMNTLQSLKEFYEDQRGRYSSPTELEMRVYHRLIHMRDQKERHEEIPKEILSNPVFQLTTKFRLHVQKISSPITKTSALKVDETGMQIFAELATVLRRQNNIVMIYLVACILERLFGKDTIEDIESIRGDLTIPEIIDGISRPLVVSPEIQPMNRINGEVALSAPIASAAQGTTQWSSGPFGSKVIASSSFGNVSQPQPTNGFAPTIPAPPQPVQTAFSNLSSTTDASGQVTSVFGPTFLATPAFGPSSAPSIITTTGPPKSAFPPVQPPTTTAALSGPSVPSIFGPIPASADVAKPSLFSTPIATSTVSTFSSSSQAASPAKPLNPAAAAFAPTSTFTTPQTQPFPSLAPPSFPPSQTVPSPLPFPLVPSTAPTTVQFPPAAMPPPTARPSPTPTAPTPKLVERQQTLWDIPSIPSPARTPALPQLKIPIPPSIPEVSTPPSPREPPPIHVMSMPLPPTPTARWFDPTSGPSNLQAISAQKRKSVINLPHLQMPQTPAASADMLSPLQMSSNALLKTPFPTSESPSPQPRIIDPMAALSRLPETPIKPNGVPSAKGKEKQRPEDLEEPAHLNELAVEFAQRSLLVKRTFKRWLQKVMDRLYEEACRRSDEYKQRLQRARSRESMDEIPSPGRRISPPKRRRLSLETLDGVKEAIQSQRKKRRVSTEPVIPLNDDKLVQQLREAQAGNQKRWRRGSFIESIRSRISTIVPEEQSTTTMDVWLSLNTGNDSTAVWLENKFDVPSSGNWRSENVFSMPVEPYAGKPGSSSPVLIVFERTPAADVNDPIERKYRVIDDCARLRDISEDLQETGQVRFKPSLLVIQWSDGDDPDTTHDFTSMIQSLREASILENSYTFSISPEDSDHDERLQQLLKIVKLNFNDALTQVLSWTELSNLFVEPFKEYASDWLDSCWAGVQFDWQRYNDVARALEESQRLVADAISAILSMPPSTEPIKRPDNLKGPAQLGYHYAVGGFVDLLAKAAVEAAQRQLGEDGRQRHRIRRDEIVRCREQLKVKLESVSSRLRDSAAARAASPSEYEVSDEEEISVSPPSDYGGLARTISTSDVSEESVPVTDYTTLYSRASTVESNGTAKPTVTVAMLRALAQGVLKSKS